MDSETKKVLKTMMKATIACVKFASHKSDMIGGYYPENLIEQLMERKELLDSIKTEDEIRIPKNTIKNVEQKLRHIAIDCDDISMSLCIDSIASEIGRLTDD